MTFILEKGFREGTAKELLKPSLYYVDENTSERRKEMCTPGMSGNSTIATLLS